MTNDTPEPGITVDRGIPVILTALFAAAPDSVDFSYTAPGSSKPYVDDGYGQPASKIEQVFDSATGEVVPNAFRYVINTTGFQDGIGWWHFWGRGEKIPGGGSSKFGTYRVLAAPRQLL